MTYKEYKIEEENKHDTLEGLKIILIAFCVILVVSSMLICADECSDTVFSWVTGLNCWIWIFCFSVFELKKEKNELELKLLSQKVDDNDAWLIKLEEKLKKDPFV